MANDDKLVNLADLKEAFDTLKVDASQSASGLMSATDKTKLDGIAAGAQVNSITGVKGNAELTYRTGNVNLTLANIGIRSGTLVKDFSNGNNHTLFSEFALTGRPTTIILTPANRNVTMRYDWDNSSTYIDLYAHEVVDGSGVTGAVRFSYIIIP